jgi:hypothetical protein
LGCYYALGAEAVSKTMVEDSSVTSMKDKSLKRGRTGAMATCCFKRLKFGNPLVYGAGNNTAIGPYATEQPKVTIVI